MRTIFLFALAFALGAQAQAEPDLSVHVSDFDIGKFHRESHRRHPYGKGNVWTNFVLPPDADGTSPVLVTNDDGSRSLFASNLEDVFENLIRLSAETGRKVGTLDLVAHGFPGAISFAADRRAFASGDCEAARKLIAGPDEASYRKYYAGTSLAAHERMLKSSTFANGRIACGSTAVDFKKTASRLTVVQAVFSERARIRILGCNVGRGSVGTLFVSEVAKALLIPGTDASVTAIRHYGLIDWSIPEGEGFWDVIGESQASRDEQTYPKDEMDSRYMKRGSIAVARFRAGKWRVAVTSDLSILRLDD